MSLTGAINSRLLAARDCDALLNICKHFNNRESSLTEAINSRLLAARNCDTLLNIETVQGYRIIIGREK